MSRLLLSDLDYLNFDHYQPTKNITFRLTFQNRAVDLIYLGSDGSDGQWLAWFWFLFVASIWIDR